MDLLLCRSMECTDYRRILFFFVNEQTKKQQNKAINTLISSKKNEIFTFSFKRK